MTQFTEISFSNLKTFRDEMNDLLEKYGVETNLEFKMGSMSFSQTEVEFKIKAKVKGAKSHGMRMLELRSGRLGINLVNDAGDELVDYNTRAYKMPYVYKCGRTGKMFKCDERTVKILFSA